MQSCPHVKENVSILIMTTHRPLLLSTHVTNHARLLEIVTAAGNEEGKLGHFRDIQYDSDRLPAHDKVQIYALLFPHPHLSFEALFEASKSGLRPRRFPIWNLPSRIEHLLPQSQHSHEAALAALVSSPSTKPIHLSFFSSILHHSPLHPPSSPNSAQAILPSPTSCTALIPIVFGSTRAVIYLRLLIPTSLTTCTYCVLPTCTLPGTSTDSSHQLITLAVYEQQLSIDHQQMLNILI